jgi:hypothetical protein
VPGASQTPEMAQEEVQQVFELFDNDKTGEPPVTYCLSPAAVFVLRTWALVGHLPCRPRFASVGCHSDGCIVIKSPMCARQSLRGRYRRVFMELVPRQGVSASPT